MLVTIMYMHKILVFIGLYSLTEFCRILNKLSHGFRWIFTGSSPDFRQIFVGFLSDLRWMSPDIHWIFTRFLLDLILCKNFVFSMKKMEKVKEEQKKQRERNEVISLPIERRNELWRRESENHIKERGIRYFR